MKDLLLTAEEHRKARARCITKKVPKPEPFHVSQELGAALRTIGAKGRKLWRNGRLVIEQINGRWYATTVIQLQIPATVPHKIKPVACRTCRWCMDSMENFGTYLPELCESDMAKGITHIPNPLRNGSLFSCNSVWVAAEFTTTTVPIEEWEPRNPMVIRDYCMISSKKPI